MTINVAGNKKSSAQLPSYDPNSVVGARLYRGT